MFTRIITITYHAYSYFYQEESISLFWKLIWLSSCIANKEEVKNQDASNIDYFCTWGKIANIVFRGTNVSNNFLLDIDN